jgi:hypothetical protein
MFFWLNKATLKVGADGFLAKIGLCTGTNLTKKHF